MRHYLLAVLITVGLLANGCQTLRKDSLPDEALSPAADCRQMLDRVDAVVAEAGTGDRSVFRVDGIPFLRTSRFLADQARRPSGFPARRQWLERMHRLDLVAREKELLTLEHDSLQRLADTFEMVPDRRPLIDRVQACSQRLFESAETNALARKVQEVVEVPDEYRTWRRVVGLYPLMALPVAYVSAGVFDKFRQWHALAPESLPRTGQLVVYRPAGGGKGERADPVRLYKSAGVDALGLPRLSPEALDALVASLAPVIVQDTAAPYDAIGSVRWVNGVLEVADDDPVVYYYLSHGRLDDRPSLQINYVVWYSHRAGENAPLIERGRLDGLTIRVSLDADGRPVILDIMNNCGCYHFFVPDYRIIRRIETPLLGLDPLVPAWLPQAFPERRLRLRVTSGWHQVLHIGTENPSGPARTYALRPYETLEILPYADGRRRSMFDRHGLAWGSGRIEQGLFFSMGIPAVGSMRQRGHHAVKLVGRAHFDHPLLFDTTFDYHGPGAPHGPRRSPAP